MKNKSEEWIKKSREEWIKELEDNDIIRHPFIINDQVENCYIDRSGVPIDPDKSMLAFEIYVRFLIAKEAENITIVSSNDVTRKRAEKLDYSAVLKDKIEGFTTYEDFWENTKSLVKVTNGNRRVGIAFVYNKRWRLLEVDTLIGTKSYINYNCKVKKANIEITHSIGNLGLVPVHSGNSGAGKYGTDYISYKFKKICEEYSILETTGFESIKDLNKFMLYGDENEGLFSITKDTNKEIIDGYILERETKICDLLKRNSLL